MAAKSAAPSTKPTDTASMAVLRAYIKEHDLGINTAGPGRTKATVHADIIKTDAYKGRPIETQILNEDSSIKSLRAFIEDNKLEITTAGKGRTKTAILADIAKTDAFKRLTAASASLNEMSSIKELRTFIADNELKITTAGKGRTKAAIVADIAKSKTDDAYKTKGAVVAASAAAA